MSLSSLGIAVASFLASAVEFVEALTIVLAMGLTRGWRSSLWGAAAALAVLALVIVVVGASIGDHISRHWLQFVVGALLLTFGLQWLRKAIFRSAGLLALHDEDAAFAEESAAARSAGRRSRLGLDWYAFTVSFKGVLLEGLEVVFIVVSFGASSADHTAAVAGAAIAFALVVAAGLAAAPAPLARAREPDQVRGRPAALDVRPVLAGGGTECGGACVARDLLAGRRRWRSRSSCSRGWWSRRRASGRCAVPWR